MRIESVEWLHALWLIPALGLLTGFALSRKLQVVRRFADDALVQKLAASMSVRRQVLRSALAIVALGLVVVSLARPAWDPRPRELQRRGRDVVFVVDVSRSMLAEDLQPNRLERAKLAIADVIERLQGDRVALVAFAGTAVMKSPLTLDYGFMRSALDDLSPESVSRGGTLIGDALRLTVNEVFDEASVGYRDVILITDGEDHESFPAEAAALAGEAGVRIIAIGIGDETTGRRIPITDEDGRQRFLQHEGQEVWSRLDGDMLRQVARGSKDGVYFNVATGNINLDEVYTGLIRSEEQRDLEARTAIEYDEKFQIFLGAALALLLLEGLIRERR